MTDRPIWKRIGDPFLRFRPDTGNSGLSVYQDPDPQPDPYCVFCQSPSEDGVFWEKDSSADYGPLCEQCTCRILMMVPTDVLYAIIRLREER
jgi:hypothetical protein